MKSGKTEDFRKVRVLLGAFFVLAAVIGGLCALADRALPESRPATAEELAELRERNSPLIEYARLSPNAAFPREADITKITIHHMAGNLSLETVGRLFADRDRRASANYGVDSEGKVGLYVEERNRAWTSSSPENDAQAVTVEVANDVAGGDWHVSGAAFDALVELCADICRRNGIAALVYTGDETGNLTTHKMFYSGTECPGPYLESRLAELAGRVNRLLEAG